MKIKTELTKTEITIEDAVFTVQELGTTKMTEIAVLGRIDPATSLKNTFLGSVIGWRGVQDQGGADLECNDENKLAIFEANQDLVEKIISEMPGRIREALEAEKKI